jgi:cytochrome c oxidase subunit II
LVICGAGVVALSGCGDTGGDSQNALAPHSHQAGDIANLFWWMMGGAWLGLGLVVFLLFLAYGRGRRRAPGGGRGKPGERGAWYVVVGLGVITPIVVLSALFVVSNLFVIRTTDAPAASRTRLTVLIVGHQWWWEVRYPESGAVTANELHIPVRTPVRVEVRTADVIHSFWVPELNRKVDAIPDKTNVVELDANQAGTYRGQCAEFCGLQHAHMALLVHADPPATFRAWLARESKPAAAPAGSLAAVGRGIFLGAACATCHAIRGTSAAGITGPDLTHFGSRESIGALTAPNDAGTVTQWINRSQDIKPGNQMPNFDFPPAQLRALVAYLEGLK